MTNETTAKWRERITRLERRMAWIDDRAVDLPNGSFDFAEASALRWAIPILKEYVENKSHDVGHVLDDSNAS